MEKSSKENIGYNLFTHNIGALSQVLQFYGFAHQGVYLMHNLWSGSRQLLSVYRFDEVLKNVKQTLYYNSFLSIIGNEFLKLKHRWLFKISSSLNIDDLDQIIKTVDSIKDPSDLDSLK